MTVTNHRRTNALIGVALAAIAAVMIMPGRAWAAGTMTLSAQTAYNCEVNTPPPPPEDYSGTITASLQLTVPSSVSPGETINLSGTLTLQFPENLREAAIVYGDTSVQGVSTTLNLGVDAAGQASDVFADEWQTPPTQIGNPMQVSGVFTMPPLTVPKNATGVYELQMPENGVTPNTAESSPATVAFTAVATASGSAGTTPIKLACYLPGSSPELGQIPIVAAAAAATKTSASTSGSTASKSSATASKSGAASTVSSTKSSTKAAGSTKASGTTKTSGTTQASGATNSAGTSQASGTAGGATGTAAASTGNAPAGASGTSATSASGDGQSAAVANTGVATPTATGDTGVAATSAGQVEEVGTPVASETRTRSGVYVSSSLLVLGGFLICVAAIGYALLANYRLRSIRRELDD